MYKHKLISFNFAKARAKALLDSSELSGRVVEASVKELRLAGVAIGRPLLVTRDDRLKLEIAEALSLKRVGSALAQTLGIKMITIPAGTFVFQKVRGVRHNGFRIAETELTNGQFRKLLELEPEKLEEIVLDPEKSLADSLAAVDPAFQSEADDCPMVFLDYYEATKIAKLLGKRLPTELEWERVAAGRQERIYSFGNKFNSNKATFNGQGTRSVKAHRDAATPEGVLDLSGNVWEWTSSIAGEIDLTDPNAPLFTQVGSDKVLRGGSWSDNDPDYLRAAVRDDAHPGGRVEGIGVRFAEDL